MIIYRLLTKRWFFVVPRKPIIYTNQYIWSAWFYIDAIMQSWNNKFINYELQLIFHTPIISKQAKTLLYFLLTKYSFPLFPTVKKQKKKTKKQEKKKKRSLLLIFKNSTNMKRHLWVALMHGTPKKIYWITQIQHQWQHSYFNCFCFATIFCKSFQFLWSSLSHGIWTNLFLPFFFNNKQ